jgi:Family of unknown function (DUF6220)
VTQGRVLFYGLAVIYLAGVVVQFFLAGLGTFGATSFDAHQAFGLVLALLTLILLVLAVVGKVPRLLIGLAVILLGLNILQMFLAQVDVEEVAALHVVNALAIVFVAYEIAQRSRRYLASMLSEAS